MGISSLYTTEEIAHVEALLDAPPAKGIRGKLLIGLTEGLKVKIDFLGMFLQNDFYRLHYKVTPCWLTNIWEFLFSSKISIEDSLMDVPVRREGNKNLMNLFLSQGST